MIFLINILEKLFEIASVKYGFVLNCRIFDPKEMVTMSSKKLGILANNIISYLLSLRIINTRYGDRVTDQFTDFMRNKVKLHVI